MKGKRRQTSASSAKPTSELQWKEIIRIVLSAILIAFLITHFIVSSTVVEGTSMHDTLQDGDRLLMMKLGLSLNELERGDIVVFHAPDEQRDYIKRIIAFPNEYVQIEDGMVYINGKRLDEPYVNTSYTHTSDKADWLVGKDQVFVLGDNREEGGSRDSRIFGPIPASSIIGKTTFRYFPFSSFGGI